WLPLPWRLLEPFLALSFGFGPHALHQRMDHRIVNRAVPIGCILRRRLVRSNQRGCKSQLLLQYRAHLLMGCQTPCLPNRTTPLPVSGILAVANLNANASDDAAHGHDAFPPVPSLLVA